MSLSKDFKFLGEAYAQGVIKQHRVVEQVADPKAAGATMLDAFVDNAAKMGMIDSTKVVEAKKELKKFFDKYFAAQPAGKPAAGATAPVAAAVPAPAAAPAAAPVAAAPSTASYMPKA